MPVLDANKFRDLTADEIIALAETRTVMFQLRDRGWRWIEKDHAYEVAELDALPRFPTKLDAADDAVCELRLDQ